nr:hypothetical protein [Janibacter melonis]
MRADEVHLLDGGEILLDESAAAPSRGHRVFLDGVAGRSLVAAADRAHGVERVA